MYVPERRYPRPPAGSRLPYRPWPENGPCPPIRTGPTTWAVGARVGRSDAYALSGRLVELIRRTGTTLVVCDVAAVTRPDAGTLHTLARLKLTAQRLGCGFVLHRAGGRLRGLVAFTGLSDVLPVVDGPRPGFETGR